MNCPIRDQNFPPPPLEDLQKLQLMRTTLVNFVDWRNFDEVVQGCFVRVLLEMRSDNERGRESLDNYYITCVKGARKGPPYSGFSCDGVSTEWHILIELPSCFRSTPNGNVVQLNSISNSAFKRNEYDSWIQMSRETPANLFISQAQIQLRMSVLEEHKAQASISGLQRRRKLLHVGDDANSPQVQMINDIKKELEVEISQTHSKLPHADRLPMFNVEQLQEVEQQCLDIISVIRGSINDKTKCRMCRKHVCTVIFYPCKHQVVCRNCCDSVLECPAPDCRKPVQSKFEAFNS